MDPVLKLAFERTYLANERTQMAWIRTALALITFGFSIAKAHQILHRAHALPDSVGPKAVGMFMITLALVSLGTASIGHRRALRSLRERCPDLPSSTASLTSWLIMGLGVVAFIVALS